MGDQAANEVPHLIYLNDHSRAEFQRLAEALSRPVEQIPEISLEFLSWYIRMRDEGYELLLGLRDDPDNPDIMKLSRPRLELNRMDENGVERLGNL